MSIYVKHEGAAVTATPYVKHNGNVVIPSSCWTKHSGDLKLVWPETSTNGLIIYDEAGLREFASRVAAGETTLNATLLADITLTQGNWTPIGVGERAFAYEGTFDGNNRTITGVVITEGDVALGAGFFTGLSSTAVVKNLILDSPQVSAGVRIAGAIVGTNDGGTIENCHVINGGSVSGASHAGGIVGENGGGTVINCSNSSTVSGPYAGGIAGQNSNSGTVNGCTNSGTVTSSTYAGGIIGQNSSSVTSCTNSGTVTSSSYAGGIIGQNGASGTISDCTNSGTVSGVSQGTGQMIGFDTATGGPAD